MINGIGGRTPQVQVIKPTELRVEKSSDVGGVEKRLAQLIQNHLEHKEGKMKMDDMTREVL
jgi:hypothetical protein